jgi:hypothetical protein
MIPLDNGTDFVLQSGALSERLRKYVYFMVAALLNVRNSATFFGHTPENRKITSSFHWRVNSAYTAVAVFLSFKKYWHRPSKIHFELALALALREK